MKFTNKNKFLYFFVLFCNVLFHDRHFSYFAKPYFMVYDEWFDNDLKKTKINVKNKKIKNISKIHEFFYEQSNFKVGASEKNLQKTLMKIGRNYLIIIILRRIMKKMIHY